MTKTLCILLLGSLLFSCSNRNASTEQAAGDQDAPALETKAVNLDQYPSLNIANEQVKMKLYLPDREKGLYRATRFDWSGVIGSVQYRDHEYFGYWKQVQDPYYHEDLSGPVEGWIEPGPGWEEAEDGGKFMRIGVGVLDREADTAYRWTKTYPIVDHGKWTVDHGDDWVRFIHELSGDFGYAYRYEKEIRLKEDGFVIAHRLKNLGDKVIETDQFNHNFFMIDGEPSGPDFRITFPWMVSTQSDLADLVEIRDSSLHFLQLMGEQSVFLELEGYSDKAEDHRVTVMNTKTGAGVSFRVDRPLYRMAFWSCGTTLSPENFIWLSVAPGEEESWTSDYSLFLDS